MKDKQALNSGNDDHPACRAEALAESLEQLTTGWTPARGVSAEALTAARASIASALASGRVASDIHAAAFPIEAAPPLNPELSASLLQIAEAAITAQPVHTSAVIRSGLSVTIDNPLGRPLWAQAASVAQSLGPFEDANGIPHFVDLISLTRSTQFAFGNPANPFGVIPVRTRVIGPITPTSLTLGAGSVWFLARLLSNTLPAAQFTGFSITGGRLDSSAPLRLRNGVYVAPATATLTLHLNLAATPDPFTPPATVTLVFHQKSVAFQAIADFSCSAFGTTISLHRNNQPAGSTPGHSQVLIPCDPAPPTFSFNDVGSDLFNPSGDAPIQRAAWALPLTAVSISELPEAAGPGSAFLEIGPGATISAQPLPTPVPILHGTLNLSIDAILLILQCKSKPIRSIYQLWQEASPSTRTTTAEFVTPPVFLCSYYQTPTQETFLIEATATAHLDRPLAADTSRIPFSAPGIFGITSQASGHSFNAIATRQPTNDPLTSLALENALLGVESPSLFVLRGALSGSDIVSGTASYYFNLRWLLPTLPDPYAANNDLETIRRQTNSARLGTLLAVTRWGPPTPVPTLGFSLLQPVDFAPAGATAYIASRGGLGVGLALLDLSTRVDLFGVATFPNTERFFADKRRGHLLEDPTFQNPANPAPPMALNGMRLELNSAIAATFALPQVSWEPMESTAFPQQPIYCEPASDGVPLIVSAPDAQQLVPFMPEPVLLGNVDRVAAGRSFTAIFSLPFGLNAVIAQTNRSIPSHHGVRSLFQLEGGVFRANQPEFTEHFFPNPDAAGDSLTGALQLRLKPPFPDTDDAKFSGSTYVDHAHGPGVDGYGFTVLGQAADSSGIGGFFEQDFSNRGGVPLRHIDLSGYGASLFSEWKRRNHDIPGIIKVQFDVTQGRTAHEVIQALSFIYPYAPRVVRTITMHRQNVGWVKRTDTGWQAVTHGLFEMNLPPVPVHKGPLTGVYNIRNIRETGEMVPVGAFQFQKVLFDGDFGIDPSLNVLSGGFRSPAAGIPNPPVFVAGRDIIGYLQMAPTNANPTTAILRDLLQKTGPLTPAIQAVIEAGRIAAMPGILLRCSAFEVNAIEEPNPAAPAIGAALRGAPQIPRGGGWSMGRRRYNETAPTALPNDFPIPLVRPNSDPNWYLADISDTLQLTQPDNYYSLLHSTGTNKVLFESPQIPTTGTTAGLQFPKPAPPGPPRPGAAPVNQGAPNLGDIASILGATGLFPDISNAISLIEGSMEQIDTTSQGLQYSKKFPFKANQKSNLIDLGIISIDLQYADTTAKPVSKAAELHYSVDSAASPSWSLTIGTLSFLVTVPTFGTTPILTITGGFKADEHTKAGLTDLNVQMGDALSVVKGVFSRLQTLAQFLPGGAGANLDVALSNGKLSVRDSFTISDLPLGLGNLRDISLNLGLGVQLSPVSVDFLVGIGSQQHPFNWIVSPLAGTGLMQFGVIESRPSFTIQAGLGLGLAIDLGIASGSASITLAIQLDATGNTITLLAILTGRASVDVLGGLVGASLTLSAALGFSLNPIAPPITFLPPLPAVPTSVTLGSEEITLLAVCSVGIHISICWVISISWDGSWEFKQSVNTPEITVGI